MKTKEKKIPLPEVRINHALNKYEGKSLFPEKLAKANETLLRKGLPKGWGKS